MFINWNYIDELNKLLLRPLTIYFFNNNIEKNERMKDNIRYYLFLPQEISLPTSRLTLSLFSNLLFGFI